MQVLLYKCNDYTITIKTSDIVAAWNRFNSRVPESSRTYCTYASTHEADELLLLKVADDGKTTAMENIGGGKEWEGQPPVLFETEIYHFFIEFNCQLLGTPRINHPKREIAECFDYHKGMLTGSINFLNNRAEMYYTGTEDTKPNLDIQSIKYFMPLIKGKINGVYKVSAINAARKRDKEINEKTSNDGVRFFLMLDEFMPFGESIDHHNKLHNGDWMTIEEARKKYKAFKETS